MSFELPFIGLLISLIFTGITGLFPGGIIVPSYLVLFYNQPERIAGTLIAALLTLLCYRAVSSYLILFGRRRFVLLLLIGGIWAMLGREIATSIFPLSVEFRIIGWVVPGLIAGHFEKQGIVVTTASLITVTVMIFFLGRIMNLI